MPSASTTAFGTFCRLLLLVCFAASASGCRDTAQSQAPANRTVPVNMVWAGLQGGGPSPTPSVSWIDGPEAINQSASPSSVSPAVVVRSDMDWKRFGLVWIRMGQKPTGGFGMGLTATEAQVNGDTVVVTVDWREPAKGAYVTQMITSPCMALKLPRGGYGKIVVKDQAGRVRASTDAQPRF